MLLAVQLLITLYLVVLTSSLTFSPVGEGLETMSLQCFHEVDMKHRG
jgi:hypothetical protein